MHSFFLYTFALTLSEEDLFFFLLFFLPPPAFCIKKVEIKQNASRGAVQLSCYILILGKIPVANTDLVIIFPFEYSDT